MAGTGQIAELVRRLEALTTPQWRQSLSRQLAEQTLQLIDDGFKGRRDPYGDAWAPTKQPNPILERTGDMRRSWSIKSVTPEGFTITNPMPYTVFHQAGTTHAARSSVRTRKESSARKMPPRRMVPMEGIMPLKWRQAYEAVAVRFIRETMGR